MVEFFNVLKNGVKNGLFQFYSNSLLMIYIQNQNTLYSFSKYQVELESYHFCIQRLFDCVPYSKQNIKGCCQNQKFLLLALIIAFLVINHLEKLFSKNYFSHRMPQVILQNNSKKKVYKEKKVPYNIFFMIHYYVSRKNCKSFS